MLKYIHKKSQDRIEKILELYKEGKTLTAIGEEVGTHRDVVKRHLIQAGIDYDEDQQKLQEEKRLLVIKYYEEGKSQIWIEQNLKMTRKTIREILKNVDVHYKTKSEQWRIRHGNTLKEDVFDTITPESAYWIGMLYTDGHIGSGKRGYNIEFGLHEQDREHLQKFLDYIRSSNIIQNDKRGGYCRVRIGSQKMHESLQRLGFTNQKSYDVVPHKSIKGSRDFWRGCIDGDGGVYSKDMVSYRTHHIYLCGTLDTVCEFIWFCQEYIGLTSRKYPTQRIGKCLYDISYYGQEAVKIADYLYKDSTTYLDRKYQKYLEIIAQYEEKSYLSTEPK